MKRYAGYIAIDRGIFDHWIARNADRFMAWEWMIAEAAHAPQGKRGTWGVVHLERGELIGTERMLADSWDWPKSNVHRFLGRLERDDMIRRRTTRLRSGVSGLNSNTESGPPTGPPTALYLEHDITILTICKYDAFQKPSTARKSGVDRRADHRPETEQPQTLMLPGFSAPLTTEPLNHTKKANGAMGVEEDKRAAPTAPRHGARSSKHGTIFVQHGTEDWRVYAEDFKATVGADPIPNRWGGYWFYALGEAARPAHQRTWRDPNAFGAAARRQGGRS